MTKIHKVVLLIVDTDDVGANGVRDVIESTRYPNRCIAPQVMELETQEVEWSDDHPLNNARTQADAFKTLFGPDESADVVSYSGV